MTSPFGPLVLIANPRAGRGKVGAALPKIERILEAEGLGYRIVRTTHPGHAVQAARDALRDGERYLVAAGGDGTVHEVVNGMLADDRPIAADAVLGVVAAGSGCDFARSFDLPGDAVQAARHLTGDRTRLIDVGKVTFAAGPGHGNSGNATSAAGPRHTDVGTLTGAPGSATITRYFPNIAEAGLGGAVVARASRLGGFLGPLKYFTGFWLTLPGFRPGTVRLDADGQSFQWRAHNVVVANCRFYGGGMRISPKSEPDDGVLDVLVMAGPKSEAFTTLPRVYRGTHLPHRNIVELRARRVRVETDVPFPIEADGETLGTTPATFEVIPRSIRVKL